MNWSVTAISGIGGGLASRALVMTYLLCYGALEIVCVLLLLLQINKLIDYYYWGR